MQLRGASGLFNLTRNLGGAVGLAIINTVINQRLDLHLARLHEQVRWGSFQAEQTLNNITNGLSSLGSDAGSAALKRLTGLVHQQAMTLAIADIFYLLTFLFLAITLCAPLMQRPAAQKAAGGGH
jgi:MFS transporter, DHA2 family, multidrug resistance protein